MKNRMLRIVIVHMCNILFLVSPYLGEVEFRDMFNQVHIMRHLIEGAQAVDVFLAQIPFDGVVEIAVQLFVGEGLLVQDGMDDGILVLGIFLEGFVHPVVDKLQEFWLGGGKILVYHPEGVDHFLAGEFLPLLAQVVVIEAFLLMMVAPEGVVTDQQGGSGIIGNRRFRCDIAHVVIGNGAVAAQDDLQKAVGGGAFGGQDDLVIFEAFDGLFGNQQDALDGAVGADTDIREYSVYAWAC